MPGNDALKRLLVKLGLDTSGFKSQIQTIKTQLNEVNAKAKKDASDLTAEAQKHHTVTLQQIDDQKRLQAEAKTMLTLDQAKAQWEKQQQESIKTKIQAKMLETAELKKQQVESQKLLQQEKERQALQKETLRLKEQEVNLFKAGTIKAAVKFEPYKPPQVGMRPEEQQTYITGERTRLLMLDKQVQALELQGKYRKVDAEAVRSLIASERVLSEAAEIGVKRELARLKTLEQEAIAATKIKEKQEISTIIPQNVEQLRSKISAPPTGAVYPQATIPQLMTEVRLMRQAEAAVGPPAGVKSTEIGVAASGTMSAGSLAQQRGMLTEARQRLEIEERTLKVLSSQEGVRKADVAAVQKILTEERAEINVLDSQLRIQEQKLQKTIQQERLQARTAMQTIDKSAVANLQQRIGFRPAAATVQPTGLFGGLFGPSNEKKMEAIVEERQHLAIMQAELKVLADQEDFRRIDVQEVQKGITAERNKLALLEQQITAQRSQASGGGGRLGGVTQALTGGGMLGQIVGGAFLGAGFFQLITMAAEKVHELGAALVEASGPAQTLRIEFEKLAERKGNDPVELLDRLRVATRGVVDDVELFKVANNFLKSNMKITTDQMLLLIQNTTNLGKSMAKTGPEIAHALEVAFLNPQRGMMQLARVTGITRETMMQHMRGISPALDATTRATIMFNAVLQEEEKMLKRVGVPAATLPGLLTQIHVASKNFIDDMAEGVLQGGNFGSSIAEISRKITELGPKFREWAITIGKDLADGLKWVVSHLDDFKVIAEFLLGMKLIEWTSSLALGFVGVAKSVEALIVKLGVLKVAQATTAETTVGAEVAVGAGVAAEGAAGGAGLLATLSAAIPVIAAVVVGVMALLGIKQLYDNYKERREVEKGEEAQRRFERYGSPEGPLVERRTYSTRNQVDAITEKQAKTFDSMRGIADFVSSKLPVKPEEEPDEETLAKKRMMDQLRAQISRETAQVELEITLGRLKAEEDATKQSYENGLISLKQEIEQERVIGAKEHQAKLKDIHDELNAKITQIRETAALSKEPADVTQAKETVAREAAKEKEEKENNAFRQAEYQRSRTLQQDQAAAYRTYTEELIKLNKEGVQARTSDLEMEFKQGIVSANDYLQQRADLIEEENRLTLQGLSDRLEAAKNNEQERAKIFGEMAEAEMTKEKELTKLVLSQDEVRLQSAKTRYDQTKKYLDTEMAIQRGAKGASSEANQTAILQMESQFAARYVSQLEEIRSKQTEGTEAWAKTTEEIGKAVEEEQRLNLELAQAKDIAGPLAGLFGQMAGIFDKLGGPRSRGVAQALQGMQASMETFSKFNTTVAQYQGTGGLFGSIGAGFKQMVTGRASGDQTQVKQTAQQMFDQGLVKSASTMDVLNETIKDLIATIREGRNKLASAVGSHGVLASDVNPEPLPLDSFQDGTDYVPQTGLYQLHKGEKVTPTTQKQMPFMGPGNTPLTPTGTMVGIMNMLGLGKYVPKGVMSGTGGAVNYLALIPQPFQSTANFINNLDPNFLQQLIAGMKSAPGSTQRRSLVSSAQQYITDLGTSGYNYSGFLNWLSTGGELPSFQQGGNVTATGIAQVDTGETVLTKEMTQTLQLFVAGLKKAIEVLQQFANKIVPGPGLSTDANKPTIPGAPPIFPQAQSAGQASPFIQSLQQVFGKSPQQQSSGGSGGQDGTLPGGGVPSSNDDDDDDGDSGSGGWQQTLSGVMGGLKTFTTGLAAAAEGVMGFVQSLTSQKSGGAGALSGAMGGGQLGGSLGNMIMPGIGGAIGAGVGAIGGGIMGGIFGAKEKQLQEDLHKIQDQMQAIIDSMNSGAITLSQAIQDLRNERQAAIQMLSGNPKGGKGGGKGKKGSYQPSQAQAAIDQIDSQIAQLVNTQAQLLSQLDQQVAVLSNPLPFQQYASSLDTIITKYQQFANAAAGNAQAVANAQLYLNESLQAYVTTLSQQLNQAQQQAIQDALTLLNLEYQRQQIINQEAQQEYDILTQGVLTRQRTTAMTKGQQIGQLQYQANMQLQQIDEQIALQQYKVSTEQQIFNLSTTRIGLEYQLLAAQEEAAGYSNQQTAALVQVVQQLQAGMASGSLMNNLTSLGPTATGTGLLTSILGTLGLGGNVPTSILTGTGGATNYLSQIPQPYQSITNFINNLDPNFLENLWNAMQTPAGSPERQSVLQEAQPYSADANTSGYDWADFASWIQGGAAIQGTTATVNNAPVATGPSSVGSTTFAQPTTPGTAPSSIASSTPSGQTPYDAVTQSMDELNTTTGTLATSTQAAATSMEELATNINAVLKGIGQGYTATQIATGGAPTGGPQPVGPAQQLLNGVTTLAPVIGVTNPLSPAQQVQQALNILTGGADPGTSPTPSSTQQQVQSVVDIMSGISPSAAPQTGGGLTSTNAPSSILMPKPISGLLGLLNNFTGPTQTGGPVPIISGPSVGGNSNAPGSTTVGGGPDPIDVQNQLLEITTARSGIEMNVISARQNQLDMETQYMTTLSALFQQIQQYTQSTNQNGGLGGSLESMFANLYETRGRYGSGGFRRTIP